jgi:hypothetical protein
MGLVGAPGGPFDGLVVVNARTIDGVDLDRLELRGFRNTMGDRDGKRELWSDKAGRIQCTELGSLGILSSC